jgi:hypothetical protein
MRLFSGFLSVAAAACVLVQAGPVGAQQGSSDAQRLDRVTETIRTRGSEIPGTKGAYICTVQEGLTVINVTSYKTGGVVEKKILTLWQGPSKVGPVSPVYNLYLQTKATSQRGGGDVSIKSTYDVIPEGQGKPLSEGVPLPTVVLPYISLHATKTHQALLSGMEEAVRIACKPKSEEPSYPVIVQLLALPTFQM